MPEENASPERAIHNALCRHDAAEVRRLLRDHPELRQRINEPVFAFNSPAIVAFAGDAAMVNVLLEAGADPNRKSGWWAGAFHALYSAKGEAADRLIAAGAVMDACAAAHLDRVDALREMIRSDPRRVHERGGDGQTPLHFAASKAVIDVLLDAGAHINARDVDHRSTPAEWMLDRRRGAGRYELAQYLSARGAATDIFMTAALGLTDRARALLTAEPGLLNLRTGRGEYGEKPPSSYHIYFWTIGDGLTALDVAAQFEQRETLEAMLAFASVTQRLLAACRQGDQPLARDIVREHPGIVASLTQDEQRVLADAAWNGHVRAVTLMLELGFDPAVPGHDSGTPLHLAAWEGSTETVAVILRHPDARTLVAIRETHYGATPLGWCCHGSLHGNRDHDHAGVARLLLAAGALPGDDTQEASPAVREVLN
jgi:ankyrin repeat protein